MFPITNSDIRRIERCDIPYSLIALTIFENSLGCERDPSSESYFLTIRIDSINLTGEPLQSHH